MTPWFAAVAHANGVSFEPGTQLVRRDSWSLGTDAADERLNKAAFAAAFRDTSLRAVSFKINAFGVQLAGTRRVIRAGFITRSSFQFFSVLPRSSSVPRTDQVAEGAPGTISVFRGKGSSCLTPTRRSRTADDCDIFSGLIRNIKVWADRGRRVSASLTNKVGHNEGSL